MHDLINCKGEKAQKSRGSGSQLFSKYSKGGVVTKESLVAVMDQTLDKRLKKIVKHADKNADDIVNKDGKYP